MTHDDHRSVRPRLGRTVAAAALVTTVLLGVGTVALASRSTGGHDHSTHGHVHGIGAKFETAGGQAVVDSLSAVDDPMAGMHAQQNAGQFAAAGMNMAAMNPDPIPEGYRRVRVDIRLQAGSEQISYKPSQFTLVVGASLPVQPRRALIGDGTLSPGMSAAASLEFDVPDDWKDLTFVYDDGHEQHHVTSALGPPQEHEH